MIGILNEEYNDSHLFSMDHTLDELPDGLATLYETMVRRDGKNLDIFLLCIQWVLFAKYPLNPRQLYYAVLAGLTPCPITPGILEVDDGMTDEELERLVLSASKGPAEIDGVYIAFIHESVRDLFLEGDGSTEGDRANSTAFRDLREALHSKFRMKNAVSPRSSSA